jgi:hypothetical protein
VRVLLLSLGLFETLRWQSAQNRVLQLLLTTAAAVVFGLAHVAGQRLKDQAPVQPASKDTSWATTTILGQDILRVRLVISASWLSVTVRR